MVMINTKYTVEPHVNGVSPILATRLRHEATPWQAEGTEGTKVLFNDILGSSLGLAENGKFTETNMTSFGEADPSVPESEAFFTGKPMLHGIGYAFLFRNYRSDLGKWATSDPLGYPDGWNNLAYCNNWVTGAIDIRGDHIYHVVDSESTGGCGHSASIVGSPEFGYHIMNFGTALGIGDSANNWATKFSSLSEALNKLNSGREGETSFDKIQRFDATPGQDDVAYQAMLNSASNPYDSLSNNCWDVIEDGLDAAMVFHADALYPNSAFDSNAQSIMLNLTSRPPYATTLNFNDVKNGLAE